MRKFSFLVLALTFLSGVALAQDPAKLIKTGKKALAEYTADPTNLDALMTARKSAEEATMAGGDIAGTWMLLGSTQAAEIRQVASSITTKNAEYAGQKLLDPTAAEPDFASVTVPQEASDKAIEAYTKGYNKAVKAKSKKKAVDGLRQVASDMGVIGNVMLGSNRYSDAFYPLNCALKINDIFVANGETPVFEKKEDLDQQKYITAIVARSAGDMETSMKYHKELYDAGSKEPAIYAGYSSLLMKAGDEEGGLAALNKGRELFPDNKDILFAEINYYIGKGDYATLETKLQSAIAQEPDNVGLYNALGNVYMNLSQEATEPAKALSYEEKSIGYYKEVLSRDDKNLDATYSIGSMYYNTAVKKAGVMNGLGTSKAEQSQYDALNAEIKVLFDKALPYFEQAIALDGSDRNTLIALKEIYARKNDYAKSKEYGARLDALEK
ncbi:MAG: tetratricopeptide repeat protein [Saprospiraceae bacterium]